MEILDSSNSNIMHSLGSCSCFGTVTRTCICCITIILFLSWCFPIFSRSVCFPSSCFLFLSSLDESFVSWLRIKLPPSKGSCLSYLSFLDSSSFHFQWSLKGHTIHERAKSRIYWWVSLWLTYGICNSISSYLVEEHGGLSTVFDLGVVDSWFMMYKGISWSLVDDDMEWRDILISMIFFSDMGSMVRWGGGGVVLWLVGADGMMIIWVSFVIYMGDRVLLGDSLGLRLWVLLG